MCCACGIDSVQVRREEAVVHIDIVEDARAREIPAIEVRADVPGVDVEDQACEWSLARSLRRYGFRLRDTEVQHTDVATGERSIDPLREADLGQRERDIGALLLRVAFAVRGIGRKHGDIALRGVGVLVRMMLLGEHDLSGLGVLALHIDAEASLVHEFRTHLLGELEDELRDIGPHVGGRSERLVSSHAYPLSRTAGPASAGPAMSFRCLFYPDMSAVAADLSKGSLPA